MSRLQSPWSKLLYVCTERAYSCQSHACIQYLLALSGCSHHPTGVMEWMQVCEATEMQRCQTEVRDRWGLVYGLPVLVVMGQLYHDGTAITNRISVTPSLLFLTGLKGRVHKKMTYAIRLGMFGHIIEDTQKRNNRYVCVCVCVCVRSGVCVCV